MAGLPELTTDELTRNRGPTAIGLDIAPRALAIVFVALRFYARRIGGSKYSWDDWILLVVVILFIPTIAVEVKMLELGLGRHLQWVIMNKPEGLPLYAKLAFYDQLIYSPLIAPIKCSILYLYIRIFGMNKTVRLACLVQIGLVIVWGLVTLFLFVFQCRPTEAAWSPVRPPNACFEYAPLFIGTNTVNVVMDFGILVTPVPSIWNLKLAPKKKIWVSSVLALGAAGCIFSALRLGILSQLEFIDVTWDHADALIWSTLETAVGTICACIPVLGPLLPRSVMDRSKAGSSGNAYGSYNSTGPRQGYAKFGASTSGEANSADDELELVTKPNSALREKPRAHFGGGIQRTIDVDVQNEMNAQRV